MQPARAASDALAMNNYDYKQQFIEFALANEALRFGQFTLKSGRVSPYFFNTGLFNNGEKLARLGNFYAAAINAAGIQFDMLYGPAYKGIPLASAVAIALADSYRHNVGFCFNRKETKDHGEGGDTFGAQLAGKVLIVDDVISAGTSVGESVDLITRAGATVAGVAIALDRAERGESTQSAIAEVRAKHTIPVVDIIALDDILQFLQDRPELTSELRRVEQYREQYGAKS